MDKRVLNILSIGILVIILVSVSLSLTDFIPRQWGDTLITGTSLVVGIIMLYLIRKKKRSE